MEAVECGAAALAMILAYHGRWVSLEELRVASGVSRDGSKASNILRAARRYGLAARGFRKEPEQLLELPLPSIIHWNFNHFVVFEGVKGEFALINDPSSGRRRVSLIELSEGFTGVALAFEVTSEFRQEGAPSRVTPMLWRQLAGSRAGLALIVLLSLTLVLPGIIVPVFSKLFVDQVLIGRRSGWVAPLMTGLLLTAILRGLILGLRRHYLLRLEIKLGLTTATRFFWHVLHLPMSFFAQRHASDVAGRITANEEVAKLLSGDFAETILSLTTLGFFAAAMAAYDFALAGIAVGLGLLNFIALSLAGRSREDAARRLAQDRAQLTAATVGAIHSIETVKSAGLELDAFSRWAGFHAKAMAAAQELDRETTFLSVIPPLLAGLGNAAILGVGSFDVMRGAMSVGGLVAFQSLAASFAQPIGRLVAFGGKLQQIKADLARIGDVLAAQSNVGSAQPGRAAAHSMPATPRLTGHIELREVTFGYNPNEPPLIENFNLIVQPGQRVALVGGSGSGKTTIGRLICGLYPVWSGAILFDGCPIDDLDPKVLANSLAYIDQDVFLFAGTIRQNITLWDESIGEARLARALQHAAMFDAIALRPGLYDSAVGEGGRNFSGGERQRLEIARALAAEPTMLVLDEATSALDPLIEYEIDDNIRRRGCTCAIIAHRYSTIRDCEEIVVLSQGRVAGRGTHAELIQSCPLYDLLLRTQ